jgi:hypothetical protein
MNMNSNASIPGPTYLGTLNSANSWRLESVFSKRFTCYELIISGMTPSQPNDQTFNAQFLQGQNVLKGPNYQWLCYSNDFGSGSPAGNSRQTKLVLWDDRRTGPKSPGIFGKMTLFIQDSYASHTSLIFAPVAYNDLGCQITITGSYRVTDATTPDGIAFGFEQGTNSGQIEVWGIS